MSNVTWGCCTITGRTGPGGPGGPGGPLGYLGHLPFPGGPPPSGGPPSSVGPPFPSGGPPSSEGPPSSGVLYHQGVFLFQKNLSHDHSLYLVAFHSFHDIFFFQGAFDHCRVSYHHENHYYCHWDILL